MSVAIERKEKSLTAETLVHRDVQPQHNALEDSNMCNDVFPDETVIMEVVSRNLDKEQDAGAFQALLRKADNKVALVEVAMASLNATYSHYDQNATEDVAESMYATMSEIELEIGKLVAISEVMADFPEAEASAEDLNEKICDAKKDYTVIGEKVLRKKLPWVKNLRGGLLHRLQEDEENPGGRIKALIQEEEKKAWDRIAFFLVANLCISVLVAFTILMLTPPHNLGKGEVESQSVNRTYACLTDFAAE